MRSRRWIAVLVVGGTAFLACKYSSPGTQPPTDAGVDAADAPPPADECIAISTRCFDSNTLRTCPMATGSSFDAPCSWGCVADGTARCGKLSPAGSGAGSADTDPATLGTLADFALVGTIEGDTGLINGSAPPTNVTYALQNNIAVFRFKKLTIPSGTGGVTVTGTKAVVLIADDVITVADAITAVGCGTGSATAPGPGGSAGGQVARANGTGLGSGAGASNDGGGGGGNGAGGGSGGNGAAGGASVALPAIPILVGGAGGGAGDGGGNFGRGGGGGGAVQLISNTEIRFDTTGSLAAGGCGGSKGGGNSDKGGGGGAGGTLLLEAPVITMLGILAVNGGGGGGGGGGGVGSGAAGQLGRAAANGGTAGDTNGGAGGAGGAGAATLAGVKPNGATNPGGGGGGVGRIRVNTRADDVTAITGVMSPNFNDGNTSATHGTATVQ